MKFLGIIGNSWKFEFQWKGPDVISNKKAGEIRDNLTDAGGPNDCSFLVHAPPTDFEPDNDDSDLMSSNLMTRRNCCSTASVLMLLESQMAMTVKQYQKFFRHFNIED